MIEFNDRILLASFFLVTSLYFLIIAAIAEIFIPTTELAIPAGIPIKEAKAEMETQVFNVI